MHVFASIKRMFSSEENLIFLNHIYSLGMLLAIAFILIAALVMQFVFSELPCPLCLLQRIAFLGMSFGVILNLRIGYSIRHEGLTMIMTILVLIISVRQTLLDIYPRPGHQYIGTAIFGLHMPVWSIVFSMLFLLAYAFRFSILGYGDYLSRARTELNPTIQLISTILIWVIISICAINLLSSFVQCGLASCHTFGYRLLS
jgi:disulfide bond formation protein DsbB